MSFSKQFEDLKEKTVAFIQDSDNIALACRWKVAEQCPWALEHKTDYSGGDFLVKLTDSGDISWYDDFHTDRYAVFSFIRRIDWLLENLDDGFFKPEVTEEVLKETILQNGVGSFENDW